MLSAQPFFETNQSRGTSIQMTDWFGKVWFVWLQLFSGVQNKQHYRTSTISQRLECSKRIHSMQLVGIFHHDGTSILFQ